MCVSIGQLTAARAGTLKNLEIVALEERGAQKFPTVDDTLRASLLISCRFWGGF